MYHWLSCVAIPSSMDGLGPYDCLMIASDPDGYGESGVGNRGGLFLLGPMGSRWSAGVINICLFKPLLWRSGPVLGEIESVRVFSLLVGADTLMHGKTTRMHTDKHFHILLCSVDFNFGPITCSWLIPLASLCSAFALSGLCIFCGTQLDLLSLEHQTLIIRVLKC